MEAEARYTYVGLGVLALLAALIASVLWLRQVGGRGDYNRFAIHFEQQALDGLEVGAEVTLRGIRVGRVEDYALTGDKLNRVRVQVRVDRRAPIRTNTAAVVTRNFVTGIAAITLVNREPAGAPLTEVPEGESLPVIAEGRSDLDEIAGRVNKVGDMAAMALNNINQLFTPESRETLLSAMRSVRDLSRGLDARLTALERQANRTLERMGRAADAVGGAASRLGDAGDRAVAVVEHGEARIDRTLIDAEQTLSEARRALDRVAAATQELQRQAAGTAQRLESTATAVDDQLQAALAELRLSVESANRVLDRLRDPRAALLGPGPRQLGPGEKLP